MALQRPPIIFEPTTFDIDAEALGRPEFAAVRRGSARKRALDLVGASLTLPFALPAALLIAALIKCTSRGPVLFAHERVGQDGRTFVLIKFRSMRDGTDREVLRCQSQRHHYASNDFKLPRDDHRITRVGKVLRATSLDELPQLLNVLRGEMSLVGIRPLLSDELAIRPAYDQACYRLMRPGMTGLWQVTGRSTVGDTDRHALDREYVETWSVWNDVKLLIRTPFAVLRFHHAH